MTSWIDRVSQVVLSVSNEVKGGLTSADEHNITHLFLVSFVSNSNGCSAYSDADLM
jgi:hypothetical protein